jgi:hypothetical protein
LIIHNHKSTGEFGKLRCIFLLRNDLFSPSSLPNFSEREMMSEIWQLKSFLNYRKQTRPGPSKEAFSAPVFRLVSEKLCSQFPCHLTTINQRHKFWDMSFSDKCFWRFKFPAMLRSTEWPAVTHVSKNGTAFIFSANYSFIFGYLILRTNGLSFPNRR